MKKMLSLMTAVLLMLSLMMMGATASEGTTDPLAQSGFDPLAIGAHDDRNSTRVADLQQKLIDLGYLKSKADGRFGEQTLAALQAFQQANNLPVTGVYDQADDAALLSEEAVNAEGGKGAIVKTEPQKNSTSGGKTTSTGTGTRRDTPDNTPDRTPDQNTPDRTPDRNTPDRNTPDNTPDRNTPDNTRDNT